MAVMLVQALPKEKLPEVTIIPASFKDSSKVASWAKTAMAQAIEMGVVTGQNGLLKPTQPATKAEAAVMLMRLFEQSERYMY